MDAKPSKEQSVQPVKLPKTLERTIDGNRKERVERGRAEERTLRSKAFASTILKIFWTFIECMVEQKMSGACIAFEKRLAYNGSEEEKEIRTRVSVGWYRATETGRKDISS
jgi:hypothetical protein